MLNITTSVLSTPKLLHNRHLSIHFDHFSICRPMITLISIPTERSCLKKYEYIWPTTLGRLQTELFQYAKLLDNVESIIERLRIELMTLYQGKKPMKLCKSFLQ